MIHMYKHAPLQGSFSVRVLVLEPAAQNDQIHCSLIETPLSAPHHYEALSYTWDGQSPSLPIDCDGSSLLITPNCQAAMRRLRYKEARRNLWIDGICIDQTSQEERSRQVVLMGTVYKKAKSVIIWLGECDPHVERALTVMREVGNLNDFENERTEKDQTETLSFVYDTGKESSKGILESLFELSWFYRMWTVQEATLPNVENIIVHYGLISFPWVHFLLAVSLLKMVKFKWGKWNRATLLQRSITAMFMRERNSNWAVLFGVEDFDQQSYLSLLSLLASMRPKQASDPRDKVFALYAVACDMGFAMPLPNYHIGWEQTYIDAAVACLNQDMDARILYEAPSRHRDPRLPFWVPDWSDEQVTSTYRTDYLNHSFHAGGLQQMQWSLSKDNRLLNVQGIFIDSIDACGALLEFDKVFLDGRNGIGGQATMAPFQQAIADATNILRGWVDLASIEGDYPTGESREAALRHALVEEGQSETDNSQLTDDAWEAWVRFIKLQPLQPTESSSTDAVPEIGQSSSSIPLTPFQTFLGLAQTYRDTSAFTFNAAISRQAAGKCFFCTKGGYFGLAANPVGKGDRVVLLKGFEVPFVLREDDGEYQVVTYGSVHGIMYGELWDGENMGEIVLC